MSPKMFVGMGPAAVAVFLVLVAMSVVSFAIFFDRTLRYRRARSQSLAYARRVGDLLAARNLAGAIDAAKSYRSSHVAAVVSAGLLQFDADRRAGTLRSTEHAVVRAERALERAAVPVREDLERGLGILATIGSTAPFVGLLGTVIGVINAFHAIGAGSAGTMPDVSRGISEALIETAVGLTVAIPAVWMYNAFSKKLGRLVAEIGSSASELVDYFLMVGPAEIEGREG